MLPAFQTPAAGSAIFNADPELPDPRQSHVIATWAHDRPLISCRFDPSGQYVFCGSEDKHIERFALADGAKTLFSGGHETWVRALAFSRDGSVLISGGMDGKLTWWETASTTPAPVRSRPAHGTQWIQSLAVSPDGTLLASGGNDRMVRLWSVADGTPVREIGGHEKHVYTVAFDASGSILYSGDLAGTVIESEVATGRELRRFDATPLYSYNGGQQVDFGGVRGLAASPDGKWLAAGGLHKASNPLGAVHEPLVVLLNRETGMPERQLIAEGITQGVIWSLNWLRDGSIIAVTGGGTGGFLLFWKPDAEKDYHRFQLPNIARDMDVHPDGIRVATAHYDRNVRITRMAPKVE